MNPRILLVSHGAAQTGAIVLLLHFARWLRSNNFDVASILMNGGSLVDDFRQAGPSLVLRYPTGALNNVPNDNSVFKTIKRSLRNTLDNFRVDRFVTCFEPNIYYLNTLACLNVAKRLPKLAIPTILHVHELNEVIDEYCGVENVKQLLARSTRIIACAEVVAENLQHRFKIDVPIDVIHEFIDVLSFSTLPVSNQIEDFRSRLGIPSDSLVVGSMGPISSRKGTDLFLQIAIQCLRKSEREMHFIWVGSQQEQAFLRCMKRDLDKAGVRDKVHFVDHLSDPMIFLSAIDVFALTSREDPFPLSVLEAAAVGCPSVCFEGAGGIPSFSRDGRGLIVSYLDTIAFADALLELSRNSELRHRLGHQGAQAVRANFNLDYCCNAIMSVINSELRDLNVR
jgi:glycosyltransferase involved in cell wall biosynthesis